jgi:hypothetical protein
VHIFVEEIFLVKQAFIAPRGDAAMFEHGAEYSEQYRCARGDFECDPYSRSESLQRTNELRRPEQMSWPKNLFGEPASLHELLSGAAQPAGG